MLSVPDLTSVFMVKHSEIGEVVGYEGPFMEIINHWTTNFRIAHDWVTDLLQLIVTSVAALTSRKDTWDNEAKMTLSTAIDSQRDLPENLNEFIRDVFNETLYDIHTWSQSVSAAGTGDDVIQMKQQALAEMRRIQNSLIKFCRYFVSHEYNALVGSFRNDHDYMPIDFFFETDGTPYDLQGFRSRFTVSRLAAFYMTAFLAVKYPMVGDEDDSFFDTFYKARNLPDERVFFQPFITRKVVRKIIYKRFVSIFPTLNSILTIFLLSF